MKDRFIFPDRGSPIKVEQDPFGYISLKTTGDSKPQFKPAALVKELQELINYINKYEQSTKDK